MKTTFATFTLALRAAVVSHMKRTDAIDDATVLNFALTLEHLGNAFYSGALNKFSERDFKKAGLSNWPFRPSRRARDGPRRFPQQGPWRQGNPALQLQLGVGVSKYTGAAQYITNKSYFTAAASILATEAQHASWVASAVNKYAGWSGALDVPLGLNQVYSIAAAFITDCPSTNPALPVKAFPSLTVKTTRYSPGKTIELEYTPATPVANGTALHVAFYTGLSIDKVVIPEDLRRQMYAVVTTSDSAVNDGNTIAGPTILLLMFNAAGKLRLMI